MLSAVDRGTCMTAACMLFVVDRGTCMTAACMLSAIDRGACMTAACMLFVVDRGACMTAACMLFVVNVAKLESRAASKVGARPYWGRSRVGLRSLCFRLVCMFSWGAHA